MALVISRSQGWFLLIKALDVLNGIIMKQTYDALQSNHVKVLYFKFLYDKSSCKE